MSYFVLNDYHSNSDYIAEMLGGRMVYCLKAYPDIFKTAQEIFISAKDSPEKLILLNAEIKLSVEDKRGNYNGVEILKVLRIRHKLLNPIIIFGFSDLASVLRRKPGNVIITAEGNKYIQLPIDVKQLQIDIENSKSIKTIKQLILAYKPFVMADFDIVALGHYFANEYGLELMLRAHQGMTGYKIKLNISKEEEQKLKWLIDKSDFVYNYSKIGHFKDECIRLRNELVTLVSSQQKKLVYIDDQGGQGWFSFLGSLLNNSELNKSTLFTVTPKESFDITLKEILLILTEIRPNLVVLDLRLYGDKERNMSILEISGFKILVEIKRHFPALPVLITSATNKSDNLNELLKAKAFGLWTKPRIEQGDIDIFEKYYNLVKSLYDALNLYKFEEEEIAVKTDFLLNTKKVIPNKLKNYLNSFDLIITDTNCWMMTCQNKSSSSDEISVLLKNLMLTIKYTGRDKFIVIDDVKRELSDHLHKISKEEEKKDELVRNFISAEYGLKLLNRAIREEKIHVYEKHLINSSVGNRFKYNYFEQGSKIIQQCFISTDSKQSLIYERIYLDIKSDSDRNKVFDKLIKEYKVHADPSFVNIIYDYVIGTYHKRNVLFISEDKDCKDNLYYLFSKICDLNKSEWIQKRTYKGVEKVIGGKFYFTNSSKEFAITLISPFKFSEIVEKKMQTQY